MPYTRLAHGIHGHPKCVDAGEDATDLFVRGISWCDEKLTDGRIPKAALGRLTQKRTAKAQVAQLLRVGLWIDHGDHWESWDYLNHNDSRDLIQSKRLEAKERMKALRANGRRSSGDVRPNGGGTTAELLASFATHTQTQTQTEPPPVSPSGGGGGRKPPRQSRRRQQRFIAGIAPVAAEPPGPPRTGDRALRACACGVTTVYEFDGASWCAGEDHAGHELLERRSTA
jgi:hypothetical protein